MARRQVPSTGLSVAPFAALLLVSLALFVFWDGPLWNAPRQSSMVGRFAVSYLAEIPLAVLALALARRLQWAHLLSTVGVIWSIKLVVTATLYQVIARGVDANYRPVVARAASDAAVTEYRATKPDFAAGRIEGRVLDALGAPLADAVAWLDAPAPGRSRAHGDGLALEIVDAAYPQPLSIAHVGEQLRVTNRDLILHTAHLSRDQRVVGNRSLPPGTEATLSLGEPGVYHLRCDNHPRESAWLVVVDHPYVARSGADGGFVLKGVPAGRAHLRVMAIADGAVRSADSFIEVSNGATTRVDLGLSPAHVALHPIAREVRTLQ
jgi:plastocyanin